MPLPSASVDLSHRAPVLCPGLLTRSADRRAFLAVAQRGDTIRGDASGNEVVLRRGGAAVAQCQVVLARAALVGVTFDRHADVAVLLQPLGLPVQGGAGFGGQVHLIVAEEDPVAGIGREVLLRTRSARNTGAAIHRTPGTSGAPSPAGASRTIRLQ